MTIDRYIEAAIPEPFVILGVPLRPFTLGALFLMRRFSCAYGSDNPEQMASLQDLLLGISICSRSYKEYLEFIYDAAEFERWHKEWGKVVSEMSKDPDFILLEKFELFNRYRRDGMKVPQVWHLEESSNTSGVHWSQVLLQFLMSELNYTEDDAMDMPLAKALHLFFAHLAQAGVVEFMDDDELERAEQQLATTCPT